MSYGGIGQPSYTVQAAASRGVAAPSTGTSQAAQTETAPAAATSPGSMKGAAITIAAMAALLIAGNIAQEKESIPVGEGLLKIRPFNVVAIGVSSVLFIVGAKYLTKKFPVPGLTDVIASV